MTSSDQLVGAWTLLGFVTEFEDGGRRHPYGDRPCGRLLYLAEGFMSAHLWDPDRHRPGSPSGADPAYFSYCGSWTLDGAVIRHHVHAATEPGWTGEDRLRTFSWRGDALELTAEGVVFEGRRGRGVLVWRRWVSDFSHPVK